MDGIYFLGLWSVISAKRGTEDLCTPRPITINSSYTIQLENDESWLALGQLVKKKPDSYLNIINAGKIERNLKFTVFEDHDTHNKRQYTVVKGNVVPCYLFSERLLKMSATAAMAGRNARRIAIIKKKNFAFKLLIQPIFVLFVKFCLDIIIKKQEGITPLGLKNKNSSFSE